MDAVSRWFLASRTCLDPLGFGRIFSKIERRSSTFFFRLISTWSACLLKLWINGGCYISPNSCLERVKIYFKMCRNGKRILNGIKKSIKFTSTKTFPLLFLQISTNTWKQVWKDTLPNDFYSFFDNRCESTVLFRGMDRDRIHRSSLQMGPTLDPGRQMGQWHIHLIPAVTMATRFQKMFLGTTLPYITQSRGCGFCYARYLDDDL